MGSDSRAEPQSPLAEKSTLQRSTGPAASAVYSFSHSQAARFGGQTLIARVWHGTTSKENRAAYLRYLKITGMKEFKRSKGSVGAFILVRDSAELTEYLVVSLWESMRAIKAFAGKDASRPVYYPKDSEFLLGLEPAVKHYEVAAKL